MTMEEISIDEFMKIDLRVAKIKNAKTVEGADKLIQLDLDLGNLGEKTVFAGIKNSYSCKDLLNRYVVCVNNLKPRKMKFGLSEGMILASGDDDTGIFIISPDKGAREGMKVR